MQQEYSSIELFGDYWNIVNLIVGEKDDKVAIFGTAFHIAPNLAVTAAHVIDEYSKWEGVDDRSQGKKLSFPIYMLSFKDEKRVKVGVLSKDGFTRYNIKHITFPSKDDDIALLILDSSSDNRHYPILDFRPPKVGTELFSIGFPETISDYTTVSKHEKGVEIGINPTLTSGYTSEVFPQSHSILHPYPGVYVFFQTDGGMSGAPVFCRQTGDIIGIVSSSTSTPNSQGHYQSFVATLAPLLKLRLLDNAGKEMSLSDYLVRLSLNPKNISDYTFDKDTSKPIYNGPKLDDFST